MSIATPPPAPASRQVNAREAVRIVEQRLQSTRKRILSQRTAALACGLFAIGLLGLGALAAIDFWLEFATIWRVVALALWAAAICVGGVKAWRRHVANYSVTQTARDAERRAALFGQRLRTTLDYESESPRPAQASAGLLDALHAETWQVSERADWDELVDGRPLLKAVALAACVVVAWFVALGVSSDFRIAAGRVLLLPWQYTTVTYTPETSTIKLGESVTVKAEVSGRPIKSASLRYRPAGTQDSWTTVDLESADAAPEATRPKSADGKEEARKPVLLLGELTASLVNLEHDLEFEVLAGPIALPPGVITVLQPLKLQKTTAHVVPPQYTGRKPETLSELELKVLEGSNVTLELELNRAAAEGKLTPLADGAKEGELASPIPFTLDGNRLRARLADLRQSVSFTITAKTADGINMEPARLSIKVKPDLPPSLQFVSPAEELSVTSLAEVPMIVEASDDIGLHKVGILYQINDGEFQTLWQDDAQGSNEPLRGANVLALEEHGLSFKDAVTYYAFAEDNYFGEPRRTVTPLRFIDIRPFRQEFQLGGECKGCKGSSATLEELIVRQRQQLAQAFAAAQQSTASQDAADKLAAGEQELLERTLEFWMAMQQIVGEVPQLEEAATKMEAAVKSLQEANLTQGVSDEQQALAALISARENLRKKLCQSQSKQSQSQKFDKQQEQKLRKPEQKKQNQEQQAAEARKKLNELAQKERKWSQQAQSACQNPGSSSSSGKPSESSAQSSNEPMPMQTATEQAAQKAAEREAASKEQEKLLSELDELSQQLSQLAKPSDAAEKQAEQAAESMKQGLEELRKQQGDAAAKAGEKSAEEIEKLAEHLAAMNAKDIGQRLEQAQKLARELVAGEEKVEQKLGGEKPGDKQGKGQEDQQNKPGDQAGKPGEGSSGKQGEPKELAGEQQGLATKAGMLADQLKKLQQDAAGEKGGVGKQLADLAAENPPQEIAAGMKQAAEDLKNDRKSEAAKGVGEAKEALEQLGRALTAARGKYAQPQLQEMMKLEEQLAQLAEKQQRAKEDGKKTDGPTEQKWQQLAQKLEALAGQSSKLAEALKNLKASSFRKGGEQLPEGVYPEMDLVDAPNIREVAKALQTQIQEAILAAAVMDADQPIPPEYKELVEKYYRALSDDLR